MIAPWRVTMGPRRRVPAITAGTLKTVVVAGSAAAIVCTSLFALQARATPAEAKAMLEKAIAHYKSVGRKQALADFTGKKAPFVDRDLYVVCVGPGGIVTAHGLNAAFVGMSADAIKDANGKPVGSTIWNTGTEKGSGSIEFPFLNPATNKIEQKTSYFQKAGDDVCAVGAYSASSPHEPSK